MAIPDEGARHNATAAALAKKKKKVKVKKPPAGAVPAKNPNTGVLEMPSLPGASSSKPKPKSVVIKKKQPPKPSRAAVKFAQGMNPFPLEPLPLDTELKKRGIPVKYTKDHKRLAGEYRIDPGGGVVFYGGNNSKEYNAALRKRVLAEQRTQALLASQPKATFAKTPRRGETLSKDEQLKMAIDAVIAANPAFEQSAKATRLKRYYAPDVPWWISPPIAAYQSLGGSIPDPLRLAELAFEPIGKGTAMKQDLSTPQGALAYLGIGLGNAAIMSPFGRPFKAVGAAAYAAKQALKRGGKESVEASAKSAAQKAFLGPAYKGAEEAGAKIDFKNYYTGQGWLHKALHGGVEDWAHGRKVWSEQLGEWVETNEPVAMSRTGRWVERQAERARKRVHQTFLSVPLSKARLSLNGDQKIMEEIARTISRTSVKLDETEAKAIILKGKKLNVGQKYAYLLIAEGIDPAEQVAVSRALVKRYLQRGDLSKAAAQAYHADKLEEAAQYVVRREDGKLYIADDAPEIMKEIETHWELSQAHRETLYENMGLLTNEQIRNRIQAPGRKHMRRSYELKWWEDVKDSEARNQIRRDMMDIKGFDKKSQKAMLDLFDAEAFMVYNHAVDSLAVEYDALNGMLDQGLTLTDNQAMELEMLEEQLAEHGSFEEAVPKDMFWSQLGGVFTAFPRSVGRWMNAEDTLSKLHDPWALMRELEAQGMEISPETVGQLRNDIIQLLENGMDDPSWFDFEYRKFLANMAPDGSIEDWRAALDEADLRVVDDIVAKIKAAHGQRNLRNIKNNDWGGQSLEERVRDMVAYSKAGAFSRDWYSRSARMFEFISAGNKEMSEKLVALAAVYSSADEVVPNLGRALKAWRQHGLGQDIKAGRFGSQDVEAKQILDDGVEAWAGTVKRSNFFKNIYEHIDWERANQLFPEAHDVTVDRWMFNIFGFDRENVSENYYGIISDAIKALAEDLGWTPKEVQAAAWVAIKKDTFKRPEEAESAAKAAARSARDWRKADRSFEEVLDDTLPYRVRFPVEARPGDESVLPNYDSWTDDQKLAHLMAKANLLDQWFEASDLPFNIREYGAGFWITESGELQINPAIAFDLAAGIQWSKKTAAAEPGIDLDQAQRDLYDFVAAGAGHINNQAAAAWFAPTMPGGVAQHTLAHIDLGRRATPEDMAKIAEAFKDSEVWFSHSDSGVFAGWADWMPVSQEEYHARVKGLDLDGEVVWFDHRNNYLEDVDAAFREARDRGGLEELARLADDLRQKADAIDADFASDPTAAAARVRPERGTGTGAAEPSPAVRRNFDNLEVGDYAAFSDEQGFWTGTITMDNGDTWSIKLDSGGTAKIDKREVTYQPRGTGPNGEWVYGRRESTDPLAGLSRETLDEIYASREGVTVDELYGRTQRAAFDANAADRRLNKLEKEIERRIKDRAQALGGKSAFFASGGRSRKPTREWEPGIGRRGAIGGAPGRYIEDMGPTRGTSRRYTAYENSLRAAEDDLLANDPEFAALEDELQNLRDLIRQETYPEWARRRLTAPHAGPQTTAGVTYNFAGDTPYWTENPVMDSMLPDLLYEHGYPDPDTSFIALKQQVSDQAPGQILFHEMAHYLDRLTRNLDLPMQDTIRRIGTSHGSYDPEILAKAMEQYLIEGSVRKGPEGEALNRLAANAMEEYAKLQRIVRASDEDWEGMTPNEDWLPPELKGLFDALFSVEGKRNEFGVWEPDDPSTWDSGRFYLAVKRGLPHSWRQPYRRMSAYRQNVSLMLSPGRRGAITMMGMDEATRHQWQGFLRDMGFFKNDLTKAMGESGIKAARLGSMAKFKEAVVEMATRVPQNADDIPIRLFPDYTDEQVANALRAAREELGRHWEQDKAVYRRARQMLAQEKRTNNESLGRLRDLMDDMEFGRRKVDYSEFDALSLPEIEAYREMHFPKALEGESIDEVVRQMLNSEVDEIPGIVWVARDALDATGFTSKSISTGQMDDLLKLAGYGFDALNAWPKMFLLQLNPAYYTMNLIGNGAMLMMQQGAFAFTNAYRASLMSRNLGEEWAAVVDNLMGSGIMKLADVEMGRHALGPLNFLPHIASNIVDKIPRRAAFLHEANRYGVKSSEQLKNLLSMAADGNEDAVRVVDFITRRANDAIVDYERLNPFEKKVITRVIFFYPWIKGATRWTMRYPLEHPVQAAAFASMFGLQQWAADRWIGEDRPWYNWLDVPLPLTADRFGHAVRYVWNPRQSLTFTTPLEMAQTILKFAGAVESGQPLASILTPVLESSLIALSGKRPFDNAETERNFGTFLGELWGLPPIVKKFQELGASTEDRLYPRTILDQALNIAFGSLAPKPIDPEIAKWRGNLQTGIPPNREYEQKIKLYEKLSGKKVGPEIHEAAYAKLGWEYLRLEARKEKGDKLTEKEQIALLWTFATGLKPELKSFDDSVMKYLATPEAYGRLRYRIEALLGWDVLYAISEYDAKAKAKAGVEPEEEWNP